MANVIERARGKAKAKAPRPRKVSDAARLADAIIAENAAISVAKPAKKRQDDARAELLELVGQGVGVDKEITVNGTTGAVKFGACSQGREVKDMRRVHELLGDDEFYALATVGLKE